MESKRGSVLMANVVFSAIVVGVVAGVGLRGSGGAPLDAEPNPASPSSSPEATHDSPEATHPFPGVALQEPAAQPSLPALTSETPRPSPPAQVGRGRIGMYSFADVADRVAPSVVTVFSRRQVDSGELDGLFDRFFRNRRQPSIQGHGSGFVLRPDGLILTNNHVVQEADELVVRLIDGREFDAKVAGTDPQTDIALLRIDARDLPTLELGDSDAMRVGDWVLAVGSPFREALETSVTAGILSGKGRGNVGIVDYEEFLQTDAAINPGNSGGPLVNLEGQVIGINTAIATRNGGYQGVSFAIPINFARPVVDALLEEGRVRRAWLGVQIQDVTPELAAGLSLPRPEGVAIVEAYEGMPAHAAGLRSGDVVVQMDGEPTDNSSKFRNRVSLSRPGQSVALEVLRDGKRRRFDVVLGELDDDVLAGLRPSRAQPEPEQQFEPQPAFGLDLTEITDEARVEFDLERRVKGVLVRRVSRGSQAAEAGLEPGDVIRAVNRRDVESIGDFEKALDSTDRDRPLVLHVKRGSQSFFVTLDPAS